MATELSYNPRELGMTVSWENQLLSQIALLMFHLYFVTS